MNKTVKVINAINAYTDNKEIKVYENGERILDIILNDYNVDGACKILEAFGYRMTYRDY